MCDITELIDEYHTKNGTTKLEASQRMGIPYNSYKQKTSVNYQYGLTVQELPSFIMAHNMDFTLLDVIEKTLGRVAFNLPKTSDELDHEIISTLAKESGEAISVCIDAIADKIITESERKECSKELSDLIQITSKLLAIINK